MCIHTITHYSCKHKSTETFDTTPDCHDRDSGVHESQIFIKESGIECESCLLGQTPPEESKVAYEPPYISDTEDFVRDIKRVDNVGASDSLGDDGIDVEW